MALENFRQVKLQMNKADGSILKTIYAKEDDYNGRELVIQITDDGIVRDLTGADVNLGWKNLKIGNQGLEPFTVVDSTQGIYKVVYPVEMLNRGEVLCTIQLIYDGSMIHSRNFKIIIESNPVDSDAVESDNNFSVLQDALIRISTLEEGYAPRLNAVEGSVDNLTDYIGNLTTLTTVEKSNIVGALNEIDTNHKSHLAETVSKAILITEPFGQLTKTTVDLGFKPKMVNISACIRATTYESEGYVDALNSSAKFNITGNNTKDIQSVYAVMFMKNSQDYIAGAVTITDTGIEINWLSVGELTDATGNRRLIITATTHGEG